MRYFLTTSLDTIVSPPGSDFDDYFFAPRSGTWGGAATLNSGDYLDGGAGRDTLEVSFDWLYNSPVTPQALLGIETIRVNAVGYYGGSTLVMPAGSGLDTIEMNGVLSQQPGNTMRFTNVNTRLSNVRMDNTNAGLVVESQAAAVAGTSDAVNISLNNTQALVALPGYETLNFASSGTAINSVKLAGQAHGQAYGYSAGIKINVTGSAAIALDASASSNPLNLNLSNGALWQPVTVKGTAGNDVITLQADGGLRTEAGGIRVDAGAGLDRVQLQHIWYEMPQNGPQLDRVETLSVYGTYRGEPNGAHGQIWATPSQFCPDMRTIELLSASSANYGIVFGTLNTPGRDYALTLLASNTGTASVQYRCWALDAGQTKTLTLTSGSDTTDSLTHGGVQVEIFGKLQLVSNGKLGATNSFGDITVMDFDSAVETVAVSGARDLVLGKVQANVIDASSFTGNLRIAGAVAEQIGGGVHILGGTGQDVLVGSTGNDIIQGGIWCLAGKDVLTGNGGSDKFVFQGMFFDTALSTSTGANVVKITDFQGGADFAHGADQIQLTWASAADSGMGVAMAATQNLTIASFNNLADIYTKMKPIAASYDAVSAVILNVQDTDASTAPGVRTFLFVNDWYQASKAGFDMLVELTGMGGTFTAANLVIG